MSADDAGVTIDHGALKVAVCQRCPWRMGDPSLAHVWTAAARHLRADHGDLAGGRKALRAALTARSREHRPYRLPHGNPRLDPRSGDDALRDGPAGPVRVPLGKSQPPRNVRRPD